MELVDLGAFGTLASNVGHPYLTIAQEIENYANTNYEGIPPANPADADDPALDADVQQKERGVLVARWYEYSPTTALDVAVSLPKPGEEVNVIN